MKDQLLTLPSAQQTDPTSVFSVIQNTFVARQPGYYGFDDIFTLVVAVVAIAAIVLAVVAYRNAKKKYIPHDWVVDPKQIFNILETSIDQRSRYEIIFPVEGEDHRPSIVSSLHSQQAGVLNFECHDIRNLSSSWIGRTSEIYFKIKTEGKFQFYSFRTVVDGIRKVRENSWMISFRMPQNLESKQKRHFLRITPPSEYVLGIAVWPTDPVTGALPTDIRLCGRPHLALVPGRVAQLELRDISAGGGRIIIQREDAQSSGLEFHIGDKLVLLLDLLEPEDSSRLRLLFHCRIQNPFIDFSNHNVELGVQFIKWGKIKEAASTELEWFRLSQGGEVEPLGNWIMRRHLEEYREQAPDLEDHWAGPPA